jgi:hypothetical protein
MYPLGTTIVLRHIISRTQNFLRGHDNDISVITVSSSGKYIASGQKTHSGFQVSPAPSDLPFRATLPGFEFSSVSILGGHYHLGLRHAPDCAPF